MPALFIGYRVAPIPELAGYHRPNYPKSCKTVEAQHEFATADLAEFTVDAAYSKLTGRIVEVFAADPASQQILHRTHDGTLPGAASPAVAFVDWLLQRFPDKFAKTPSTNWMPDPDGVYIYGFDVQSFCRVAGVEAALSGRQVPVGFWYGNRNAFDPYEVLTESDQRKRLTITDVLRLAGLKYPAGWTPHVDVRADAKLTAELVYRLNLYGDLPPITSAPSLNTPEVSEQTAGAEQPAEVESATSDEPAEATA